jgi:hypothetical protein
MNKEKHMKIPSPFFVISRGEGEMIMATILA